MLVSRGSLTLLPSLFRTMATVEPGLSRHLGRPNHGERTARDDRRRPPRCWEVDGRGSGGELPKRLKDRRALVHEMPTRGNGAVPLFLWYVLNCATWKTKIEIANNTKNERAREGGRERRKVDDSRTPVQDKHSQTTFGHLPLILRFHQRKRGNYFFFVRSGCNEALFLGPLIFPALPVSCASRMEDRSTFSLFYHILLSWFPRQSFAFKAAGCCEKKLRR